MTIYDKAAWQIDHGVSPKLAVEHFELVFRWLEKKGMLSAEGKEILDIGIDDSASLNERYLEEEGIQFLDQYYDVLITKSKYDVAVEEKLLEECYSQFHSASAHDSFG